MITITENDVLAGRGTGSNQFIGNIKFRALVETRKKEYVTQNKHKVKKKIATEILSQIHQNGGRFLKLIEDSAEADDVVENGIWIEESEKEALDKIKMCLRQKAKDLVGTKKRDRGMFLDQGTTEAAINRASENRLFTITAVAQSAQVSLPVDAMAAPASSSGFRRPPPPYVPQMSRGNSAPGPPLGPFQMIPLLFPPTQNLPVTSALPIGPLYPIYPMEGSLERTVSDSFSPVQHQPNEPPMLNTTSGVKEDTDMEPVSDAKSDKDYSISSSSSSSMDDKAGEDNVTDYLLSVLALSGRSKFTDKQLEEEAKTLTEQERAAARLDIYGKVAPESKWPRLDVDADTLAHLVEDMRVELNRIPNDEKGALMEAQVKGRREEFSRKRLEMFLKCEGMNPEVSSVV
jgi:hypothetical protein